MDLGSFVVIWITVSMSLFCSSWKNPLSTCTRGWAGQCLWLSRIPSPTPWVEYQTAASLWGSGSTSSLTQTVIVPWVMWLQWSFPDSQKTLHCLRLRVGNPCLVRVDSRSVFRASFRQLCHSRQKMGMGAGHSASHLTPLLFTLTATQKQQRKTGRILTCIHPCHRGLPTAHQSLWKRLPPPLPLRPPLPQNADPPQRPLRPPFSPTFHCFRSPLSTAPSRCPCRRWPHLAAVQPYPRHPRPPSCRLSSSAASAPLHPAALQPCIQCTGQARGAQNTAPLPRLPHPSLPSQGWVWRTGRWWRLWTASGGALTSATTSRAGRRTSRVPISRLTSELTLVSGLVGWLVGVMIIPSSFLKFISSPIYFVLTPTVSWDISSVLSLINVTGDGKPASKFCFVLGIFTDIQIYTLHFSFQLLIKNRLFWLTSKGVCHYWQRKLEKLKVNVNRCIILFVISHSVILVPN